MICKEWPLLVVSYKENEIGLCQRRKILSLLEKGFAKLPSTMDFVINEQLAQDSAFVTDWSLSRVLLMNDARFPWLILVPRRPDMVEFFDLTEEDQQLLTREISRAGSNLKKLTACDKVNICVIGNQSPQLHVHVIARQENDDVWPSPVWSRGFAVPYKEDELKTFVQALVNTL